MNKEITNAVNAADKKAQYDECAKRLLCQKIILAHILVKTVEEFKGMKPEEAVTYIEGEPCISAVPVEPGLTNREKELHSEASGKIVAGQIATGKTAIGQKIIGMNTENTEINEGMVRFDVVFYVRMKFGLSQIIINLEIQKYEPTRYCILNRSIFYVSRLISSQKGRDFVNSNYDDIRQVYSIWICMSMKENSLNHVHLVDDRLIGDYQCKGNIDLLNIVMIGLSTEIPEHEERYELHRLLGTLFSKRLDVSEKLDIIEKEYSIPVNEEFREEVNVMCNLGEGIEEEAMERGLEKGLEKGIGGLVEILMELETPKDIIIEKVMEKFSLSETQVKKYMA